MMTESGCYNFEMLTYYFYFKTNINELECKRSVNDKAFLSPKADYFSERDIN